ncbi:MAG: DUF3857 domain-containing protein [Albidovulum sp.]
MRILAIVFSVIFLSFPAMAQDLLRANAPDWVDVIDLAEPDAASIAASSDGVYYALVDTQVAWDAEQRLTHYRLVTQVIDRAGLERAASISRNFDPVFETLTLTRLQVLRDGQAISFRDDLASEIFRRETRLDAGIIDGTLTAHLQIPDLRVGDIVDYAFLTTSKPVLPEATRAGGAWMEYGVPVALTRHVAHWPSDWPLHVGSLPKRVSHETQPRDGVIRHEWRRAGHIPPPEEEKTPVEDDRRAVLQYGAWAVWSPLVAALAPHYLADYPLPPDWLAKVDAIRSSYSTDLERASAALRLVQDEIRYVGIEVGAGGFFARAPMVVTAQGFGDCKDKALLLRVLLSALEVTSYPGLADLDEGYALANVVPSLSAFDHMIVRIDIGDQSYWVDPTGSHEGGRLDLAEPPDYGWALPLTGAAQTGLERMDVSAAPGWNSHVTERYSFSLVGVSLAVSSEFRGGFANSKRYSWATDPHKELSRSYFDFYARRYPGLREVTPLSLTDDRDANLIRTEERYFLPAPALFENDLREGFVFSADNYGRMFPGYQSGPRLTPLFVGGRTLSIHTIEVLGASIRFRPDGPVKIKNAAFDYAYSGRAPRTGKMTLNWRFETLDRTVPANTVESVIRDAKRMDDSTWFTWDLTPAEAGAGN